MGTLSALKALHSQAQHSHVSMEAGRLREPEHNRGRIQSSRNRTDMRNELTAPGDLELRQVLTSYAHLGQVANTSVFTTHFKSIHVDKERRCERV